jgi:hypothetical protein
VPRWKSRVRHFLVWSSVPPLIGFYRWIYRLAIWGAAQAFRRCRGVVAVYLSRGCAKNDITPGVSDIDLVVIAGPSEDKRQQAENLFQRLQTVTGGLIPYLPSFVMTEHELPLRWKNTAVRRYQLIEGRSVWRLLHGREVRGILPPMTELDRIGACFAGMSYWWVQFALFLLENEEFRRDPILRRSIVIKAVSEVASTFRAMQTGEFCYSRTESLQRENTPLSRKLLAAAPRIPRPDPAIEEEAYRYLIATLLNAWDTFRQKPFFVVHPEITQSVEPATNETEMEIAQPPFREICRHLTESWGSKCQGVHLLKSAFYPMDCSLLVVDGDRGNLPTLADLERLMTIREQAYAGRQAAQFVLRLDDVGLQLTPMIPGDAIRGLLTPATTPDIFLQLGVKPVYWTSHTQWYLCEWNDNRMWLDAPPRKLRQLEAIARSAATGHVHYPLHSAALTG